jgi:hypothetical protein
MSDPCRVSADLRYYQSEQNDLVPEAFDEYDAEHVSQIAPHGLASEIQGLLLARREWKYMNLHQRSEQMESLLDALYKASQDVWRDL